MKTTENLNTEAFYCSKDYDSQKNDNNLK